MYTGTVLCTSRVANDSILKFSAISPKTNRKVGFATLWQLAGGGGGEGGSNILIVLPKTEKFILLLFSLSILGKTVCFTPPPKGSKTDFPNLGRMTGTFYQIGHCTNTLGDCTPCTHDHHHTIYFTLIPKKSNAGETVT